VAYLKALYQELPEESIENHNKLYLKELHSKPRFEPVISQVRKLELTTIKVGDKKIQI
jgi:hypothetical protein